jgi:phage gpG-like protein
MSLLKGYVVGGQEVAAQFGAMPSALRDALKKGITRASILVQKRVKEKLSDDVLHVRTGRLRRSINYRVTEETDGKYVGFVGTNVQYAKVHEFGFTGVENVREHLRHTREHGSVGKDGKKRRGKLTGNVATVRAHTRRVHFKERSFLRTALAEEQAAIRTQIDAEVSAAYARILGGRA